MNNYVQPGKRLDSIVAPYQRNAGQAAKIGTSLFGVFVDTTASGASGVIDTEGVFDITKATTVAFVQGGDVYWDDSAKNLTTNSTSNLLVGVVVAAAATTDTTVRVKLKI